MAFIARVVFVLLGLLAGPALVGGGMLLLDSLGGQANTTFVFDFRGLGIVLAAVPILLSLLWLWGLSRFAFGRRRAPRTALAGALAFLIGAAGLIWMLAIDAPI